MRGAEAAIAACAEIFAAMVAAAAAGRHGYRMRSGSKRLPVRSKRRPELQSGPKPL